MAVLSTDNPVVGKQSFDEYRLSFLRISTFPCGQNGHHIAEDIFRCIFMNFFLILIKISLEFVPKGPIDNDPALV